MSARRGRSNTRWAKIRQLVIVRDQNECKIPGCALPGQPVTEHNRALPTHASIDHIIPWSKGGTDALENLRLSHGVCNRQRGKADSEEDPVHAPRGSW